MTILSVAEKIYRVQARYFERPVQTNTKYGYEIVQVIHPHDFVIKIKDERTSEFESRLCGLLQTYVKQIDAVKDKDDLTLAPELLYVGMPVVVKYTNNNNNNAGAVKDASSVARAEVIEVTGKNVTIGLVDFGGVLSASVEEILPVTVELLRIPKLGMSCRMAHVTPETGSWSKDAKYKEDFTGKTEQWVLFADYFPNTRSYEVTLEVDGVDVSTKYFHMAIAQPIAVSNFGKTGRKTYPVADYSTWVGMKAIVFGVRVFTDDEEGGKLKCVLQMQPELVNTIQDNIVQYLEETSANPQNTLIEKVPGVACLARYGEAEYFRAIILQNEGNNQFLVEYVDYKDKAVISGNDLMKLPNSLLDLPEGAVVCQLTDFLITPCKDVEKLKTMVENEDLYAVVDACDPDIFGTELLVSLFKPTDFTGPDTSFSKIFEITDKPPVVTEFLQEFEPVSEAYETLFLQSRVPDPNKVYPGAMISVVNSWDSMWIQLAEEIDMAVRISSEMTEFYLGSGCSADVARHFLREMAVGHYVAAQQADEDDVIWYRGKILQTDGDRILVQYLDYGNADWVSKEEVFPLHNYFAKDYILCFEIAMK